MIKGVTFDLWDTMIRDDSDEPKRLVQGLPPKPEARRELVWAALNAVRPIDRAEIDLAYDVADAGFRKVWHDLHVTWTIGERLQVLLSGLGRDLPKAEFAEIVKAHEQMELTVPPDPIAGIEDALEALHGRYRLCVISDTIVSPAKTLRELLAHHGLAAYFDGFAFSDEVGHSKPHPSMFETAVAQLDLAPHEMVHVGDRDHNDIQGAHRFGMKAVLFTGSRDQDSATTKADAVIDRLDALPAVIDRLSKGG